ncbi:gag-pol polyprotein [Hordeum vulgare]|nr:gag-pol polyprotein [Hordeum vulgare]
MDRENTSNSVYHQDDRFDAMKNFIDAKIDSRMEELKFTDELYLGALKVEQELMKDKASPPRAHFMMTMLHDDEHEDGTTKMSKSDELQNDPPKFKFIAIPLCRVDDAEYIITFFEDGTIMIKITEPLKEYALEARNKVGSQYDTPIYGGESEMIEHGILPSVMEASDDVKSLAFIHGDGDEMVENGIWHRGGIWR